MDNLDQLSDDELRRRLLQFGFPNLPVTSTTRKTLVKKLRNYMDTERSKLRRETHHAARYSSDEDNSDHSSSTSRSGRKSSSRTTAANSNRSTIAGTSSAGVGMQQHPATAAAMQDQPIGRRLQPHQQLLSRSTIASSAMPPPAASPPPRAQPLSRSPTVYVSPMLHGSSGDDDSDDDEDDNGAGDVANMSAASTDFGSQLGRSPALTSTLRSNNGQPAAAAADDDTDAPYISEFTQRLLKLRGLTMAKDAGES